jgi:glycosyltransferase involved in cell wall biosynthesis
VLQENNVLLGYLHMDEVSTSFHKSLIDLMGYESARGNHLYAWATVSPGIGDIPGGRNDLFKQFLESPCEWLFMVDSDMGFEPNTLEQLLLFADKEERPIIGGLAFAYRQTVADGLGGFRCFPMPTLLEWVEHEDGVSRFTGRRHYPVNQLMQVGATGGALLLIHRQVAQRVKDSYGEDWFTRIFDDGGGLMGEDISFFARTQALDIPLYVHTGIRTTHHKRLWVGEQDFWMSFRAPYATEPIDVIVPVLHRPQNIPRFMESLRASTGLATAWFVCEEDDDEEIEAALDHGAQVLTSPDAHSFAEKVNLAYAKTSAPWLLLVGDDVYFRPGWLDHVQDVYRRYGANVVGTNDLCNPRVFHGEHATHSAIRRSYIDELGASWDGPGVVCHEGYHHWYVDDEICTVAKQRETFTVALGSEVEHVNPLNGVTPMDEVYVLGQKHAHDDKKEFVARLKQFAS